MSAEQLHYIQKRMYHRGVKNYVVDWLTMRQSQTQVIDLQNEFLYPVDWNAQTVNFGAFTKWSNVSITSDLGIYNENFNLFQIEHHGYTTINIKPFPALPIGLAQDGTFKPLNSRLSLFTFYLVKPLEYYFYGKVYPIVGKKNI
jgi:hypothetical protein